MELVGLFSKYILYCKSCIDAVQLCVKLLEHIFLKIHFKIHLFFLKALNSIEQEEEEPGEHVPAARRKSSREPLISELCEPKYEEPSQLQELVAVVDQVLGFSLFY